MKHICLATGLIALFWTAPTLARPQVRQPSVPAGEALALIAKAAKTRITRSEALSIYRTPTGAIAFLGPLIQDRLQGKRAAQPLPVSAPGDDCLADVLHTLAGLAADGSLSNDDWMAAWAKHGMRAATAYAIVTRGGKPTLFEAAYTKQYGLRGMPPSAVGHWFASYAQPGADLDAFARNSVWESAMVELAVAKLSAAGKPARDALVKMMAETVGRTDGVRHRTEFVTLHVLGSAGDPRLATMTFSTLKDAADVDYRDAALQSPGKPTPTRWTEAGYFWKHAGCGTR